MLGTQLNGRYQILKFLGRGGFGQTFLAEDSTLTSHSLCVIKLLDPDNKEPENITEAHNRFKQEIDILAKLNHPQIPQLLDSLENFQHFYLVQEYIDGHSLSEELPPNSECWSESQVITMLRELLTILVFIHQHKIIHRDIKPENILRRRSDKKLVLIDFGAAKQITNISLYKPYTISIGTPGYMPLEQQNGSPVFKSDVYALGIIAILALTGKRLNDLPCEEHNNIIQWHQFAPADLSRGLKQLIDKMVYPKANRERYSTVDALQHLEDLQNNIKPTPTVVIKIEKSKKSPFLILLSLFLIIIFSSLALAIKIKSQFNTGLRSEKSEYYQEALAFSQRKDYKNALINYEKVLKNSPDYYEAWLGKADSLKALKDYSQAIEAYTEAINLNQNSWQAWLGKANIYSVQESTKKALEAYKRAFSINPNLTEALKNIAHLSSDLGESKQSAEAFKEFLSKESGSFYDWYFYAKVLYNIGDAQASLNAYDRALEKAQKTAETVKVGLDKGNILFDLKEYPEAVKEYDKIITIQPDNYRAWYRQGKALEQIYGQEQAAIESYTKSLEINPSYFYAKRNLTKLKQKQQKSNDILLPFFPR